jgi:hypothetical protein
MTSANRQITANFIAQLQQENASLREKLRTQSKAIDANHSLVNWSLVPMDPAASEPDFVEAARQADTATGLPSLWHQPWMRIFVREIKRWCQHRHAEGANPTPTLNSADVRHEPPQVSNKIIEAVTRYGDAQVEGADSAGALADVIQLMRKTLHENIVLKEAFRQPSEFSSAELPEHNPSPLTDVDQLFSSAAYRTFALGSPGMLIELIISQMDGGGKDMWQGRTIAFVASLTPVLCYLRDRGHMLLDLNKFIEFFELPVIEQIVWDKTLTIDGKVIEIQDPLFDKVLEPLKTFVLKLPSYTQDKKGKQEQITLEQHGFITMPLTRLR